ncbi:MAG: hypothetical protein AAGE99_04620 [Chlamydiota bacterium]
MTRIKADEKQINTIQRSVIKLFRLVGLYSGYRSYSEDTSEEGLSYGVIEDLFSFVITGVKTEKDLDEFRKKEKKALEEKGMLDIYEEVLKRIDNRSLFSHVNHYIGYIEISLCIHIITIVRRLISQSKRDLSLYSVGILKKKENDTETEKIWNRFENVVNKTVFHRDKAAVSQEKIDNTKIPPKDFLPMLEEIGSAFDEFVKPEKRTPLFFSYYFEGREIQEKFFFNALFNLPLDSMRVNDMLIYHRRAVQDGNKKLLDKDHMLLDYRRILEELLSKLSPEELEKIR